MIDPGPLVTNQGLLQHAVQVPASAKLAEDQRFDIVDRHDELAALVRDAGVIGKMEQIIRTDQEGCDLLPEASLEERKPDDPVADVRTLWEPIRIIRHQDLVSILPVHPPDRFDQSPTVPPQANIEI